MAAPTRRRPTAGRAPVRVWHCMGPPAPGGGRRPARPGGGPPTRCRRRAGARPRPNRDRGFLVGYGGGWGVTFRRGAAVSGWRRVMVEPDSAETRRLLEAAGAGDRQAFEQLFALLRAPLRR